MENNTEKPDKILSPAVAIDGSKIKAIREEKKLTQLYVANVVGVTTDTISRWENNRYPGIKRENAEKLAIALEVDLDSIVRADISPEPAEAPTEAAGGSRGLRFALLFIGIVLLVALTALFFLKSRPDATAQRILPRYGAPGEVIPVRIKVSVKGTGRSGIIVREQLPEGWRFIASNPHDSSGSTRSQEVKWLIPAGSARFEILYTVEISGTAPLQSDGEFKGSIVSSTDGSSRTAPTGGGSIVSISPVHWADANGDGRIDDDEIMPAYYLTEEMKGLGLDWKTIEDIWNAGGYHWDPRNEKFTAGK